MPATTKNIRNVRELRVYQDALRVAMALFELSKDFPAEERFALTGQLRRSSRSVCSNMAEAWRKRRYPAHFVSKLSDAEGESEETRVWIEFALRCGYLTSETADELDRVYDRILGQLVRMMASPSSWSIRTHRTP